MRWLQVAAALLCLLIVIGCGLLIGLHHSHKGPCGPGSRPCKTTPSVCVPQRSWCNKHIDCPNGDDENSRDCADFSGSYGFLDHAFSSRKPPAPKNECRLTGYPSNCSCTRGTSLNCKHLGFTVVPSGVTGAVTRLILLNNSIESVDPASLAAYPVVHLLHLASNRLVHIPAGTFSGKRSLVKLLLSGNKLVRWSVDVGELEDLGSLEWLLLDQNMLSDDSWPFRGLSSLRSLNLLNLTGNRLKMKGLTFPQMDSLQEIDLRSNKIQHIEEDTFMRLKELTLLDLQKNDIRSIHPAAFNNLIYLQELNLAYNKLVSLPDHVFDSLESLTQLYLSGNPIIHIPGHLFYRLHNLTSLFLQDIDIDNIDIRMFSLLPKLNNLYFKFYYYCSFAPHVPLCRPNDDGVSSLEHLLHALPLRLTVWVVASFTVAANILVLSGRAALNDDNRVISLVIRSLAAADLLMGVYLLVIAVADEVMRGEYHRMAYSWMTSWGCTAAGVLSMLSSEVSVMTLVFMSLDRFLLIADPLGRKLMSYAACAKCVAAIWVSGIVLAILPVVVHWRTSTRFYGTNGMCFPLHIDDPFLIGWQYSSFVFLGVNGASLLLVALLYLGMFLSIVRTRRATPLAVGDVDVAVRFFFIVLTDACCWAPIAFMKVLALARVHISAELYAWVMVFLVPINSAINPLLYTLTIPKYRQVLARLARGTAARCCGRVPGSRRQSADTESSRTSHSNRIQMTSATGTGTSASSRAGREASAASATSASSTSCSSSSKRAAVQAPVAVIQITLATTPFSDAAH